MRALAFALLLAVGACRVGDDAAPELERLRGAIGTRRIDASQLEARAADAAALDALTEKLEVEAERSENATLDWRIGECHRMRDVLGNEGAWELAEQRFRLALARDPKMAAAHVSLGQLYLNGGPEFASKAEREFVLALEKSNGQNAEAHKGLFFAYSYLGRFDEALKEAARYEALAGPDADFEKFRAMAETNAGRPNEVKR